MKKKFAFILIFAVTAIAGAFCFTACDSSHNHSFTDKVVQSTCTDGGYTEHTCSCGESYRDNQTPPKGHTEVIDEVVIPTCKTAGLTPGKHCGECNAVIVAQTEIPKLPHTEVVDKAVAATCTETGLTEGKHCAVCGQTLAAQSVVPVAEHDLKLHNGQVATCTKAGWQPYFECTVCGYSTKVETAASGHYFKNGRCVNCNMWKPTEGLEYELSADGTYYICNGIGTATDSEIFVADYYNGLPVKAVGDEAFSYNNGILRVYITGITTRIGSSAFRGCVCLKQVDMPQGVVSIGSSAFYGCVDLIDVFIPESVTAIGKYAFYGSGLTDITIPKSVTRIGEAAFEDCAYLKSITVDDGNANYCDDGNCLIERETKTLILGCMNSVIPSDGSVTSIGKKAFYHCVFLKEITVPASVKYIGETAFSNCTALTGVTISDGVKSIGKSSFAFCTGLQTVILPQSVTDIGKCVFMGCLNLASVNIPDGVTRISANAFDGCGITGITIPDGVKSIDDSAFSYCSYLESITIPESVTSIGNWAFTRCLSLKSVTIPDAVTEIGYSVFSDCDSLTSVKLPKNLKALPFATFSGCRSLASITIPDGVESIGSDAFRYTALYYDDKNWDNGVLYIGNYLIEAKSDIAGEYVIKAGTLIIADYAFSGCNGLESVIIPDSVKSVGYGAFKDCVNLTGVTIPLGVTYIPGYVFNGCSGLTSITIPDSVTGIGVDAFSRCDSLTDVTFNGTKAQWQAIEKHIFWDSATGDLVIRCTDGDLDKDGNPISG